MNRNSLLKSPIPEAPLAFTGSRSDGSSMLAQSCTGVPSRVAAAALRSRFSLSRSSRVSFCLRRYSASTERSGLTITTPCVPSTMMSSSSWMSVRDQDRRVGEHGLGRDAPLRAGERAEDALGHLAHVVFSLAQVRVLDVAELRHEEVELRAQRPFGVAVLLADDLARRFRESAVLEEHQVHLDEGRELGGGAV